MRKGVVTNLADGIATVESLEMPTRTIAVPDQIVVEVGTQVTIVDVGDDKPIVMWGGPIKRD